MNPKLSYLCLFENPSDEAGRALIRQFVLVREADRMGYDEIWIGEHHGDSVWPTPASTALTGYLAGVTQHARIGVMAVQTESRDPRHLAAELSTLDLLSKGRLNLGVSFGSPFKPEYRPQGVDPAITTPALRERGRLRARERVEAVRQMLVDSAAGMTTSYRGATLDVQEARLVPRFASPEAVPTWVATHHDDGVSWAAEQGLGLMAGPTATTARLQRMRDRYRSVAPGGDPRLVLARFTFAAENGDEARRAARAYLEVFAQRMQRLGAEEHPGETVTFDIDALLAQSLVGSWQEVADQILALQAEVGVHSLAVIPTSSHFDTVKRILADLVDEVRPLLSDD